MANCACCHHPLHVEIQESYFAGRPSFEIATCRTPGCDLESVTRSVGDLNAMTPAEIASYAAANARLRARMEVYA